MIFHKSILLSAAIFSKAEYASSSSDENEMQVPSLPYLPTSPQGRRRTQASVDPSTVHSCGSCCYEIESASTYSDKLDLSFYSKVINTGGFLVASSSSASDAALYEAALTFDKLTRGRPDFDSTLVSEGVHLAVIGKDEDLTDVPEYKSYASFWNRFRALGATSQKPVTSCSEENLLCLDDDVYSGENICVHVNAHTLLGDFLPTSRNVERFGSEDLEQALIDTYEKSIIDNGLWDNTYAATNYREYFAEGLQSFFDVNAEGESDGDGIHNTINTRNELLSYDEDLYNILERGFSTEFAFECPEQQACDCSSFSCPHVEAPSVEPSPVPSTMPSDSPAPSVSPSIEPSSSPSMESSVLPTTEYFNPNGQCYIDAPNRDMPHRMPDIPNSAEDSIQFCLDHCENAGYLYAGIQWTHQCFCDDTFGSYGIAPLTDCYINCMDGSGNKCGGGWRQNIYLSSSTSPSSQ